MFESGLGGDFETYLGAQSGTIYRLDLAKVHYEKRTRPDLLADATKKEGRLIHVPEEIRCKICSTIFEPASMPIDGEEIVDAYEI
ncbi:MAG: hypothetical protein WC708_13775 [Lentisphaeria bacterium]